MTLSWLRRTSPARAHGSKPRRLTGRWLGILAGAIGLMLLLAESLARCTGLTEFAQSSLMLPLWGLELLGQTPDQPEYRSWLVAMVVGLVATVALVPRWRRMPSQRSRALVVAIVGALTLRYIVWRVTMTLNFSTVADGLASGLLLVCEIALWVNSGLDLALMLRSGDRRAEAARAAALVATGYQPTVDIWIPTYGEPVDVLRRTVIGCQALNYGPKQIYLLDDGRRPEVRDLAQTLGCHYLTRANNTHAKAGNLNHALGCTQGELIVCFDADFVPTRNFLQRTVGFFHDPSVGLVQTRQHFFNPDPIVYNLGLGDRFTTNRDVFSRYIQSVRDGVGASICYGSSFVVRRSALEQVGGFVTSSLCEDYFTGIALMSSGYQIRYLNEALSAGLSPESMSAYIAQQQRWAAGTMQGFFIPENPLTIRGLTLVQRLHYAQGWFYWGLSLIRLLFLVAPLPIALLGISPMQADVMEWLLWFLPLYVAHLATCNWLNRRSCSATLGDVYAIVNCFPIALTVLHTLWRPFGRAFRVTPKGIARDRAVFNPMPGLPLLGIWGLTAMAWGWSLAQVLGWLPLPAGQSGGELNLAWLTYNLLLVGAAVLASVDAPKPNRHEWFRRDRPGLLQLADRPWPMGVTLRLASESGAIVALTRSPQPTPKSGLGARWATVRRILLGEAQPSPVTQTASMLADCSPLSVTPENPEQGQLHLIDRAFGQPLVLPVRLLQQPDRDPQTGEALLEVAWEPLTPTQQRQLVEWLYCQPGQWQSRESPGELASLGLLLRSSLWAYRRQRDRRAREAIVLP